MPITRSRSKAEADLTKASISKPPAAPGPNTTLSKDATQNSRRSTMSHWSTVKGPLNEAFKVQRERGSHSNARESAITSTLNPTRRDSTATDSMIPAAPCFPGYAEHNSVREPPRQLEREISRVQNVLPRRGQQSLPRPSAPNNGLPLPLSSHERSIHLSADEQNRAQENPAATRKDCPHPAGNESARPLPIYGPPVVVRFANPTPGNTAITWQDGPAVTGAPAMIGPSLRGPQISPPRQTRTRHQPHSPPERSPTSHRYDNRIPLKRSSSGHAADGGIKRHPSVQEMYLEETKKGGRLPTDINCFGLKDDYEERARHSGVSDWATSDTYLRKQKKAKHDPTAEAIDPSKIAKTYSTFHPRFVPKVDNNKMISTGSTFKLPIPAFVNRPKNGFRQQVDVEQSSTRKRSLFRPPPKDQIIEILDPEERQRRRSDALRGLLEGGGLGLVDRPLTTTSSEEASSSQPEIYKSTLYRSSKLNDEVEAAGDFSLSGIGHYWGPEESPPTSPQSHGTVRGHFDQNKAPEYTSPLEAYETLETSQVAANNVCSVEADGAEQPIMNEEQPPLLAKSWTFKLFGKK